MQDVPEGGAGMSCRTCIWWDIENDVIQGDKVAGDIHSCKRMPPVVDFRWPMTGADDWCGEYLSEDKGGEWRKEVQES